MATVAPPKDRDGFEIAIICALKLERDAVETLMEADFKEEGRTYGKASQDRNAYTTGVLGGKAVVLAYPRDMGTLNAASVASDMRCSFRHIKLALVVGVAGGAPQTQDGINIYLGDVVISTAVIQYDFGRQYPDGFRRKNELESTLSRASPEIANFLSYLDGSRATKRLTAKIDRYNHEVTPKPAHPGVDQDHLFASEYRHKHRDPRACEICSNCKEWYDPVCERAEKASCEELGCDQSTCRVEGRPQHTSEHGTQAHGLRPARIHFGRVASGNGVIKSGFHRDKLVAGERVIGFEMEGAGTWDQLPTVIVKSVCDYADSHKNKGWQGYAAATAASCAKAMLEDWEVSDQAGGK